MPVKKKTVTGKKAAPARKTVAKKTVSKKSVTKTPVSKKTVAKRPAAKMSLAKKPVVVKKTTVQPKAKTVTKRVKSAPKSLALKGDKRILTHAAWKREMMKKRMKKS